MGCGSSLSEPDEPYVVVVFGATGYLGGAVARRLLEEPFRYRVRCITRRSSGEKAKRLAELGMPFSVYYVQWVNIAKNSS